jgi:glycosyltransferase involved in cell wall biosynthesis
MVRRRPQIAFFDYPDVFEDFYPQYGLDQRTFATRWADAGNHAFLTLLQRHVGDVVWNAFSLKPEFEAAYHERVGCKVRFFRSSWLHRSLWRLFYAPRFAWRWPRIYPAYAFIASYSSLLSWSFLRALRQDRPDFIFVQDYATGRFDTLILLAALLGVPLVARHSGSWPEGYVGKLAKRWTIRCADRLIVSSQRELDMLEQRYRVPRERLSVILTPIDIDVFRPLGRLKACHAVGLDSSRRYLLFAGRLVDSVKRVSALIRAFASVAQDHPDVDLLIAGIGPDEERLRQLAHRLAPDHIRFLGWITPEQKPFFYNLSECLMLASKSEGFPNVVGEAMACGTPVVASDVGGIRELVVDGHTGWLFETGDDAGLLQALNRILSRPEQVAQMRLRARKAAENRISQLAVAAQLQGCFCSERKA